MKQASAAEVIIGSGEEVKSGEHVAFVNSISERDALKSKGFVFVRNAYLGDKTVHRGWAVYIWGKRTQNDTPHWIKTIEEESVDGLWSVRAEILETMATKAEMIDLIKKYSPIKIDTDGNYILDGKTIASKGLVVSKELVFGVKTDDKTITTPNNYGARNGWYFKAIDTSDFDFTTNEGTIDFYLSDKQPTIDGAKNNDISTAFDESFESGFKVGRMAYIRNGKVFADCGEILAVVGNKITVGNITTCPVNKTSTTVISPFENYDNEEYRVFDKDGKLLTPNCPKCGQLDEWSISMTRRADGVVDGTLDTENVGGNVLSSGGMSWGWNTGAFGDNATVLGINSVCYGKYTYAIGAGLYNQVNNSLVVGRYNEIQNIPDDVKSLFCVGIGVDKNDRKDGFRVYEDGSTWINKVGDVAPILPTEKKTSVISEKLSKIMRALGSGRVKTLNGIPFVSGGLAKTRTSSANQINKIVTSVVEDEEIAVAISNSPIANKSEILWSVDGVNFYKSNLTNVGTLNSIVYSEKYMRFFAAGNHGIYWSIDGRIWTKTYDKPAAKLTVAKIGDEEIITSGFVVSRDGLNWTATIENVADDPSGAVISVNDTVVCCASSDGVVKFSKDYGNTWEDALLPEDLESISFNSFSAGTTKSGAPVIFATAKDVAYPVLFTKDGEVWEKADLPEDKIYNCPTVIGEGVVIVPQNGSGLLISKEFEDESSEWGTTNVVTGSFTEIEGITLNGNKYFVCCAANDKLVAVSSDKLNWATVGLDISSIVPNTINGVVLFPGYDYDHGIYMYSVSEIVEYFVSAISYSPDSVHIEPIGDEWTEDTIVAKINEIIEVINRS